MDDFWKRLSTPYRSRTFNGMDPNVLFENEDVLKALKSAYKSINKNIYEWHEKGKYCSELGMRRETEQRSYDQVVAIVKNWVCIELRGFEFYERIKYMLRRTVVKFDYNSDRTNLTSITFEPGYRHDYEMDDLNTLLKSIDFEDVKYTFVTDHMNYDRIKAIRF